MTLTTRIVALLLFILVGGVDFHASNLSFSDHALNLPVLAPVRALAMQEVWFASPATRSLGYIGRGKGIVFSPDLSEPGNRDFYQALGFAYFEDPDWHVVINQLRDYNRSHPDNPVTVLLIQSHGTSGDALKLQAGSQPDAPRSYISPGGLLESLTGTSVRACLLAACNAGRLFRAENFYSVKAEAGNHLFEPATLGVINASRGYDPSESSITLARRAESHIEVINELRLSEFAPATRKALFKSDAGPPASTRIAVPEMLIQLLLSDRRLHLVADGFEIEKSKAETNDNYREHLISSFLRFINSETPGSDLIANQNLQ